MQSIPQIRANLGFVIFIVLIVYYFSKILYKVNTLKAKSANQLKMLIGSRFFMTEFKNYSSFSTTSIAGETSGVSSPFK